MNFCDPDLGNSFLYMTLKSQQKKKKIGISLVIQWLTICLPMQETRVQSLMWGDSTCQGATKPVCRNYWACALEPRNHGAWVPRAHAPQQEKPLQWEAHAPHKEPPPPTATRDSLRKTTKTQCSQKLFKKINSIHWNQKLSVQRTQPRKWKDNPKMGENICKPSNW